MPLAKPFESFVDFCLEFCVVLVLCAFLTGFFFGCFFFETAFFATFFFTFFCATALFLDFLVIVQVEGIRTQWCIYGSTHVLVA